MELVIGLNYKAKLIINPEDKLDDSSELFDFILLDKDRETLTVLLAGAEWEKQAPEDIKEIITEYAKGEKGKEAYFINSDLDGDIVEYDLVNGRWETSATGFPIEIWGLNK